MPRVGAAERTITGHIDFLQVRNGCVHILDYKPDARTNKPIAQLAIYALALTRLVPGLKLFDIKCAWFNEEEYCEFFPRTLFLTRGCLVRQQSLSSLNLSGQENVSITWAQPLDISSRTVALAGIPAPRESAGKVAADRQVSRRTS